MVVKGVLERAGVDERGHTIYRRTKAARGRKPADLARVCLIADGVLALPSSGPNSEDENAKN